MNWFMSHVRELICAACKCAVKTRSRQQRYCTKCSRERSLAAKKKSWANRSKAR